MKTIYTLILAALLFSCKKTISIDTNPYSNATVYAAGTIFNGSKKLACVWKNGVPTIISDVNNTAYVTSIAVSGNNDVYVGGSEVKGGSGGFKEVATIWKNGIPLYLTDISSNADNTVRALYLSGNDVYASGNFESRAAVWKNGAVQKLTSDSLASYANGLFVQGNDVYVVGSIMEVDFVNVKIKQTAVLWKNGVMTKISDKQSNAVSVYVSGNDVYITGLAINDNKKLAPTLWKNGTPTLLENNTTDAEVRALAVSGTSVYVAGNIDNGTGRYTARVWKNNTLFGFDNTGYINNIFVLGQDMYAVGAIPNDYGGNKAVLWKNGRSYEYPAANAAQQNEINALYVTQ
ncbi:hypothetical protein [Ferruginibacter sp.]